MRAHKLPKCRAGVAAAIPAAKSQEATYTFCTLEGKAHAE